MTTPEIGSIAWQEIVPGDLLCWLSNNYPDTAYFGTGYDLVLKGFYSGGDGGFYFEVLELPGNNRHTLSLKDYGIFVNSPAYTFRIIRDGVEYKALHPNL